MHATQVCHKLMNDSLCWMHDLRRDSLNASILAAIHEKRSTVTGLGRAIKSEAKEKHCIKRADRLLSNVHLYAEHRNIYHTITQVLVGTIRRPVILLGWSDLDERHEHYLLCAAIALEGRSLTLYEEVHTVETKENRKHIEYF